MPLLVVQLTGWKNKAGAQVMLVQPRLLQKSGDTGEEQVFAKQLPKDKSTMLMLQKIVWHDDNDEMQRVDISLRILIIPLLH